MTRVSLLSVLTSPAGVATVLRGGIVAVSVAVLLALAAGLGLSSFGTLMVDWGLALLLANVVSFGVPLYLLRVLPDGCGLRLGSLACLVVLAPVLLAFALAVVLPLLWPGVGWTTLLLTAIALHLVFCLSSVMRALGSIQWSMILRDGSPVLALGCAGLVAPAQIIPATTLVLGGVVVAAALWCALQPGLKGMVRSDGRRGQMPVSFWGTSVLGMGLAQVDIILGSLFLPPPVLGLYAVLRRISNLVALPITVATWVTSVPVAKAFGAADRSALARASQNGSRIALLPGVALFCLGLCALAGLGVWLPGGGTAGLILLCAALIQVIFAASFTVATLCDLAWAAAQSRLISILGVVGCLGAFAPGSMTDLALIYGGSCTLGTLFLWAVVQRRLGIDTSAFAFSHGWWRRQWTQS